MKTSTASSICPTPEPVFKLQTIGEDFCGLDVNTPLGGETPMTVVPVLLVNQHLTAVAATSTGDYTVVFLGTANGRLKKVVVESSTSAIEYGNDLVNENSPVNADLHFDSQMMHLYVMTERQVAKVKVQDCSVYNTCLDCLGAKDPYCGWCSLENKCSLKSDCQDAGKDVLYWISYKSGKCTTITSVAPYQIQRTTARTLDLVIENLPSLSGQFLCAFTALDKTLTTPATRKATGASGVNCTTPRTDLLPPIPPGQHHFTAKLSVRMTSGPDFVETNFTFFDCNTYISCTQCVSSAFPCDWCVDGHRCTHDTAENCRNDILVTGVSRIGPSYRSGPGFCPTINATQGGSTEILVSSGVKKGLRVKVHIIGQFIVQTRFVCQFNIEGRVTSVNANILGDIIYCEPMEFSYTSRAPNITATFAVIWGGSKPLDNPDNIHVVIYRCRDMADNCGMCLALGEKFGCGWCQSSDRCEVQEQCDRNGGSVWLNRNTTCPNPEVTSFSPQLGPWEGGTNITITGINLGKTFKDIYSGVSVAGIPCEPYEELYEKTKQIVCRVDGPGTPDLRRGLVVVKVEDFRGNSKQEYKFVDPNITDIFPNFGPMSGGTHLTIMGRYMNAGSSIRAFIDELPCQIIKTEPNSTVCVTSASKHQRKGTLKMKFDEGDRPFDKKFFEYIEDPEIDSVESGVTAGQGQHLDRACQELDVVVRIGSSYCNVTSLSRQQLTCRPPVEQPPVLEDNTNPEEDTLPQVIVIAYRRKSTESNRVLKNMQEQMDILELRVAAECKEAFAELQTEMTDLTQDLTAGGIPFLDYRTYALKTLFPNMEDVVLQWERPELMRQEKGLRFFGSLILNKTFLLLFIRTLESNRYFSMRDRTESVAEKMLSAWFTFLLYKFLRECAGEPLYMLFRAMKHQVDKGPVDVITSEARYSLSEEKLIRQSIDFKPMTVYVSISQQTVFVTGLDPNTENVPVKVLDCDTISQVKEKALDTIYRATPYSQRPRKDDLDVEWRTGTSGRLILYDEDSTTKTEGEWKKRNTLNHYRVPDMAYLNLVSKQSSIYNLSILSEKTEKSHKYETLNLSKFSSASPPLSRATSPLNNDQDGGLKVWHLVKHHDSDAQKEGERGNKMVSEIYLTRLLATKGTLQKFVDDLFETIFSTAHRGSALPLAIKYMFDFLDDQALQHGITDPEVVHTWKSNSLPLRFWVNLIKNPNFVFDIHKSNIVDSCLSVVAQTFMDSCSTSDHRLGKDSPSSKLLYAKDIPVYKEWVERYYADIKAMPAISDQDMGAMLAEESRLHSSEFNTNCALYELYTYAMKYNEQLTVTLEEDEFSQKQRLAYKLEQVHNLMIPDSHP
ncbi:unnamed protein product [Nezara viridula]|uniref:Sema domain-containing protein n=1 Tax=Nezara viridula TaxID=85310 RepID=A0A9P0EEK1_NEZVI|nr:unnamed protein product [Nezara viridula]